MELLRFTTAGSVDDGKSTLTGRLLYNTGNIKQDTLKSVSAGDDAELNLAFITDGLRSERAQGITIDVAYKFFSTSRRKFIVTDAPGHFQYTRNLVTGASGTDLMIILIDAQHGITEQTRRHSLVAAFLDMRYVIIAVNKMDLKGYDASVFDKIRNEYLEIATQLQLRQVYFIPISALLGDNITEPSGNMPWYRGMTLLQYMETLPVLRNENNAPLRVMVQFGILNGMAAQVLSGTLRKGDEVLVQPSGKKGVVEKILHGFAENDIAYAGQNIWFQVTPEIPGGIITHGSDTMGCKEEFIADICWLDETSALVTGREYIFRMNGAETKGLVHGIARRTLTGSFEDTETDHALANDFVRASIRLRSRVAFDTFSLVAATGRGIIMDPDTNYTSGAFIIIEGAY